MTRPILFVCQLSGASGVRSAAPPARSFREAPHCSSCSGPSASPRGNLDQTAPKSSVAKDRGSRQGGQDEARAATRGAALPSVDRLAREVREADPSLPAWSATAGARRALAAARAAAAREPEAPGPGGAALPAAALAAARALARPRPGRVVNATGVVLHTNLGRAVLAPGAAEAVARAAAALQRSRARSRRAGERGDRLGLGRRAARRALGRRGGPRGQQQRRRAAARGGDPRRGIARSSCPRGELVEIGGSFRIPEILEKAGARLVEVGTTNRTHPEDYRRAAGPRTGLLPEGAPQQLRAARLRGRGRRCAASPRSAPSAGCPWSRTSAAARSSTCGRLGLPEESYAPARLAAGADLVCFSGDKLLGGPQAGILLGRGALDRARARATPSPAPCASTSSASPPSTGPCARCSRGAARSCPCSASSASPPRRSRRAPAPWPSASPSWRAGASGSPSCRSARRSAAARCRASSSTRGRWTLRGGARRRRARGGAARRQAAGPRPRARRGAAPRRAQLAARRRGGLRSRPCYSPRRRNLGAPVLNSVRPRPQPLLPPDPRDLGAARLLAALPGHRARGERGVPDLRLRRVAPARRGARRRERRHAPGPHAHSARDRADRLRSPAAPPRALQPHQHHDARPLPVSVLRRAARAHRAEPRPRRAARPRRADHVGERRHELRRLQSATREAARRCRPTWC